MSSPKHINSVSPAGLDALAARVHHELSLLDLPAKQWTIKREVDGKPVLEVAIVGAGMAGLTVAASLGFLGIPCRMFDRASAGFEGPWVTSALMETLRSPKQLTGPALGIPSLTFRAWFEAQFGSAAWEALDKIPRVQWMDYLRWYREVLNLKVSNDHVVTNIIPRTDDLVELHISNSSGGETLLARRVVIASGRAGLGGAFVPDIAKSVPKKYWAHSSEVFDYTTLKHKKVGVIGAGASAMDSAATALEAGASSVDLIIRRDDIPRINKGKGSGNPGITLGYYDLPDEWKWRIRHYINGQQVPPPRGSTLRVSRHANARFNVGCPIERITEINNRLEIHTPKGIFELDFVIFSTGFIIDWAMRPEYASIAPYVKIWGDRYTPTEAEIDYDLISSPDVGPVFELQEKKPGSCPSLARIHCFCYPSTLSHGQVSGDIPAISDGAKRLTQGIASLFYREDIEKHFEQIKTFSEPEIFGDEWTVAPPPEQKSEK